MDSVDLAALDFLVGAIVMWSGTGEKNGYGGDGGCLDGALVVQKETHQPCGWRKIKVQSPIDKITATSMVSQRGNQEARS